MHFVDDRLATLRACRAVPELGNVKLYLVSQAIMDARGLAHNGAWPGNKMPHFLLLCPTCHAQTHEQRHVLQNKGPSSL